MSAESPKRRYPGDPLRLGVIPSSAGMLRKIAIIGANGFVGRHVLELFVQHGVEVIGVVRSEAGSDLVRFLGGAPLRVANLEKAATAPLHSALEGCDGVVYTASVSTGSKSADRTDPEGLDNILAACLTAAVPAMVFFSGLGIAHYGMNPHCTNPYFLGKMAGEVILFRSPLATTVFRPSYIFGAGDEFLSPLIRRVSSSASIEVPGDGLYRLQPVSVRDAARAVFGALNQSQPGPRVVDLVGPESLSYRALVGRVATIMGRNIAVRERSVEEALAQARSSGYFGLRPQDLACLLCDELSDPQPVESLVGGPLESLDALIAATVTELEVRRVIE